MALIEAAAITEEGGIIPTTSVGASPTFVSEAEKILIELNTSQPLELEGIHDIYYLEDPPARKPIPLISPYERIGSTYIPIETEKILGIVVTDIKDGVRSLPPGDDSSDRIAAHLIEFLYHEVKKDRLPHNLLPIQSGVGSTANAVLEAFWNPRLKIWILFRSYSRFCIRPFRQQEIKWCFWNITNFF